MINAHPTCDIHTSSTHSSASKRELRLRTSGVSVLERDEIYCTSFSCSIELDPSAVVSAAASSASPSPPAAASSSSSIFRTAAANFRWASSIVAASLSLEFGLASGCMLLLCFLLAVMADRVPLLLAPSRRFVFISIVEDGGMRSSTPSSSSLSLVRSPPPAWSFPIGSASVETCRNF